MLRQKTAGLHRFMDRSKKRRVGLPVEGLSTSQQAGLNHAFLCHFNGQTPGRPMPRRIESKFLFAQRGLKKLHPFTSKRNREFRNTYARLFNVFSGMPQLFHRTSCQNLPNLSRRSNLARRVSWSPLLSTSEHA